MSILLGVFGLIFGVVYYISYNFNEQHIEQTLEDTAASYLIASQAGHVNSKSIIAEVLVTNNAPPSVIKLSYDSETFKLEDATYVINIALDRAYFSGRIGNVFYKTFHLQIPVKKSLHCKLFLSVTLFLRRFQTKIRV